MSRITFGIALALLLLAARPSEAMLADGFEEAALGEGAEPGRQEELYEQGTDALDEGQWDRAAALFAEASRQPGERADGALYWKAYAQSKLGRRGEALATVGEFKKRFPKSRWSNDAAALEMELQGGRNVAPESVEDEELKLVAINSLLHTDADRAIPMLEKFLKGNQPPKLKDRALFVLAQHGSARAREIVADIARGKTNPGLQEKAIHYLGLFGGEKSAALLSEIYSSPATSVGVKEKILHSYMISGNRQPVLDAAKSEKNPELRAAAAHQLGIMGARGELWQLYQSETSADVKESIIQGMFIAGDGEHLLELARSEKSRELRLEAIQKAGLTGNPRTGEALTALYRGERDAEVKGAVIQAFFLQGNARALIDIARTEKDRALKEEAVQKLSLMRDKEATDYLMEILNR
jgi:hypothetical protein